MTAISSLGGCALNPRGNIWLNDNSTLGHKLMMKMGWSRGKGLGKNEDGIKENLKIKFKSTNSGVGFKDESFFKIQSTEYDSLLKRISENCSYQRPTKNRQVNEPESLEQRSQKIKNRLHYQKFVRGKDMSNYSNEDMKSIFILNKISDENKESSESFKKESRTNETLPNLINTYSSNISISDYFTKKKKEKSDTISEIPKTNSNVQQMSPEGKDVSSNQSALVRKRKFHKKSTSSKDIASDDSSLGQVVTGATAPIKRKYSKYLKLDNCESVHSIHETSCSDDSKKQKKKSKKCKRSEILYPSEELNEINCQDFEKSTKELVLSPPVSIDSKEGESQLVPKQSRKHKSKHLKKLRSCLRNKSRKYNVKNVAFDENVSYQVIESICKQNLSNFPDTSNDPDSVAMNSEDIVKSSNKADIYATGENKIDSHNINIKTSKVEDNNCLRKKSRKYNVKNVTYDENVSYQVIETICKRNLNNFPDASNDPDSVAMNSEDIVKNSNKADVSATGENKIDSHDINIKTSKVDNNITEDEGCSLSYLPNQFSQYYNSWVESQRSAMTMRIYKDMFKNIKKDMVLCTSNLLSIRGYGNWGF